MEGNFSSIHENDRYRRQVAFAELGKAGQARLLGARVAIVGVGALGSVIAERLVRSGRNESGWWRNLLFVLPYA